MTSKFWKLPQNMQELLDAVSWAAGGRILLQSDANSTIVLEILNQPASGTLLLHMINYNAARVPSVGQIEITLRLPDGREVEQVTVMSPDRGSHEVIPHKVNSVDEDGATVSFTVPDLETYNLVAIH
jgi:hypothetical protein